MKRIKYAIIVFYLMLFAGLALYDEKPAPGLMKEMAQKRPETMDPGNAWMASLGFASPKGISPYAYAAQKMERLKTAVASGEGARTFFAASMEESKAELKFQGKFPTFYNNKDNGILAYAATHENEVAALRHDNAELVRRYETLRNCRRYSEPLNYGFYTPLPSFGALRNTQKVKLLQLAVTASQGETAQALSELREDAEFWRFVSRSSSTLISKLISIANLGNDLRFAAELGVSRPLAASEVEILHEIIRPFAVDEASLAAAIRGEARYFQRGMELSYRQDLKPWDPKNILLKPNATDNRMYLDYQEFIRLAALPPQEFAQQLKKRQAAKTSIRRIGLPFLYNPAGEILASIGRTAPGFENYMVKGHDLEGLRRLVCLKILAHREAVTPQQMQQFVVTHAKDLGNPYTGAPMTLDAKKGTISFIDILGEKQVEIFL